MEKSQKSILFRSCCKRNIIDVSSNFLTGCTFRRTKCWVMWLLSSPICIYSGVRSIWEHSLSVYFWETSGMCLDCATSCGVFATVGGVQLVSLVAKSLMEISKCFVKSLYILTLWPFCNVTKGPKSQLSYASPFLIVPNEVSSWTLLVCFLPEVTSGKAVPLTDVVLIFTFLSDIVSGTPNTPNSSWQLCWSSFIM